jgi:hypothetical protein
MYWDLESRIDNLIPPVTTQQYPNQGHTNRENPRQQATPTVSLLLLKPNQNHMDVSDLGHGI